MTIVNFDECTVRKLATRVKNYLDWMSVGDQKTWQGQLADYMDIDTLNMSKMSSTDIKNQEFDVHNLNNNERVVLPGNRINWSQVNNIPSFMMAFRCLMRTNNSLRNEVTQWLRQRPFGGSTRQNSQFRRGNDFIRHSGFRPRIQQGVNEIDEDGKFDIFNIPSNEETNNQDKENLVSEQIHMSVPIGAKETKDSRRLLHCGIYLNKQCINALIDIGAAVCILSYN